MQWWRHPGLSIWFITTTGVFLLLGLLYMLLPFEPSDTSGRVTPWPVAVEYVVTALWYLFIYLIPFSVISWAMVMASPH